MKKVQFKSVNIVIQRFGVTIFIDEKPNNFESSPRSQTKYRQMRSSFLFQILLFYRFIHIPPEFT